MAVITLAMARVTLSRNVVRYGMVLIALALMVSPATAFLTHAADSLQSEETKRVEGVSGQDRDGYTVITTQQFQATYPDAELVVVAPNGSTAHVNSEYDSYFDVDPVPDEPWVIEYGASKDLSDEDCNDGGVCTREVFVRENFRTGESEVIWSRVTPKKHNTRVHDIDRVNETHIAVADIYQDAVFLYDTERELQVWRWEAQDDFPIAGGGPFPEDWTHVNDVEVLANGQVMASLRNQDSVVFIAPNGTLLANKTLGEDGAHETLYEQHNPDYLQGERPTVLVANSENNRIDEFERSDGEWERTWTWRDAALQWPRDADRLPNGHTLITDTQTGRVIEINETGDVIWTVEIGLPYDAERLSTGDESAGGPPASAAGLPSRDLGVNASGDGAARSGIMVTTKETMRSLVPPKIVNGILFILPPWAQWYHIPLFLLALLDLLVLGVLEFRWSAYKLQRPVGKSS